MAEPATTNAMVLQPVKPMDRFRQDIVLREDTIRKLLPKAVTFDKFMGTLVAAVSANPKLLECDRGSMIKACIQAAELGLSLNPTLGEGDILQVWDNRTKSNHAQFRPRYMGLMKLARQSGEVLKIEAEVVRENDEFLFQKGTDPRLEHKIKLGGRGQMIAAYCVWHLKNGSTQFEVMDRDQVIAIRDRSSAKTKEGKVVGPWMTDEEEMWRKTAVRRASKYMPRSCEAFDAAVAVDNLHEAGRDVEIHDGEVIDVTEPDEVPTFREAGAAQVHNLAEKLKPAAAKTAWTPEIIAVPQGDDGMSDWTAWCALSIAALLKLENTQINEWIRAHKSMLDEAELMAPNEAKELMGLIT